METLSGGKDSTFFELTKNTIGLDLRDNRGKIHCLSIVLLVVIVALYRCRDGNLSSIHRALTNKQTELCQALDIAYTPAVSRAQLPIILKKRMSLFFQNCTFCFSELSYVQK